MLASVRSPQPHRETALDRREFLASWLGALLFWRHRGRVTLADISFDRIRHGREPRRYLRIHGNEQTARDVLAAHLRASRGTAYLVRNDTRNVPFLGGELDPNRMFSRQGAERNLRLLNPRWSDARIGDALDVLDRTRGQILKAVLPPKGDVLIAVHNNSGGYSVDNERDASDRLALNDAANPHEFCLCTQTADFERLASGPYNVILQSKPGGTEDGSLSRYATKAGYRYVNIEAGVGKAERQRAILEWVDGMLPRS